jgi:uncharacterized membrane protein
MPISRVATLVQKHKQGIFYSTMALLLIIGAALRFYELGAFSFWDDELFSVSTVTRSGPWNGPLLPERSMAHLQITDSFWTWKLADPHPPLYEVLLVPWIALWGTSEFAVRSFSAVLGVVTMLSVFALPHTITRPTRIVYMLLLATSGCLIIYSQDARNYALSACLTAWMFAHLINQIENAPHTLAQGRPTATLLTLGGLLALNHYYGLVFVLCVAAFTAVPTLQARSVPALISVSTRWFLALLPAIAYIALGWVGIMTKINAAPPNALSLAMTFKRNFTAFIRNFSPGHVGMVHFWIALLLSIACYLAYRKMRKENHPLQLIAGYIMGISTLFFMMQIIGTRRAEFVHERYMIFIIPGCLLLTAIFTQTSNWIKNISLFSIPFIAIGGLLVWNTSPKPQGWGEWKEASAAVARDYQPGDIIIMPISHQPILQAYFQHYLKEYIPLSELEQNTWDAFDIAPLVTHLRHTTNQKQHLILFSHFAFEPQMKAALSTLETDIGCTSKEARSYGTLRITEISCKKSQ